MKTPTHEECATNWELWMEYVDPNATMTEEEFDGMTTEEKIQMQIECFGEEEKENQEVN